MGKGSLIISSIFACIIAIALQWLCVKCIFKTSEPSKCWQDLEKNETICSHLCENGKFSLPGMDECHELLNCDDEVLVIHLISYSTVKNVYLAQWNMHLITMSELSSPTYKEDFEENLKMLKLLGPNPFTVQFLGSCGNIIYTQYHKMGSASSLNFHLENSLKFYDTVSLRFNLCIQYVKILDFLHDGPMGTRVMCDSNTLEKTLSQYLLTDDLSLVLNDLDALPRVDKENNIGVLCGKKPLYGTFVAPEQTWKEKHEYSPDLMKRYDEKIDIWRVPNVCNWFLSDNSDADIIKFKLFKIHKSCKNEDPAERPTAKKLLEVYSETKTSLNLP